MDQTLQLFGALKDKEKEITMTDVSQLLAKLKEADNDIERLLREDPSFFQELNETVKTVRKADQENKTERQAREVIANYYCRTGEQLREIASRASKSFHAVNIPSVTEWCLSLVELVEDFVALRSDIPFSLHKDPDEAENRWNQVMRGNPNKKLPGIPYVLNLIQRNAVDQGVMVPNMVEVPEGTEGDDN